MSLVYEREISLGSCNKPIWGHEPDNLLWQYNINPTTAQLDNSATYPPLGQYDELSFQERPHGITQRAVYDFGVKTLPHYGAYAFFTPTTGISSFVLMPLHYNRDLGRVPEVVVTISGTQVTVAITSQDLYECYRIELQQSYTTSEYIVYAQNGAATKTFTTELNGSCLLRVTGYSDEISIRSNVYEQIVTIT